MVAQRLFQAAKTRLGGSRMLRSRFTVSGKKFRVATTAHSDIYKDFLSALQKPSFCCMFLAALQAFNPSDTPGWEYAVCTLCFV